MNNKLPIEEYFTYHPVMTDQRKLLHEQTNLYSLELAKLINTYVDKDYLKYELINQLQFIRMMLNQYITIDELNRLNT